MLLQQVHGMPEVLRCQHMVNRFIHGADGGIILPGEPVALGIFPVKLALKQVEQKLRE